jgi:predicted dehydrogenase
VNIAVLGLGSSGSRHARLLLEQGHEVVGFDPAERQIPGVRILASENAAVDTAEAVIVASPSSLHERHALLALGAGRHVLVEKPLAWNLAGGRKIVEAARVNDRVCAVGLNLRYHPAIETLARLICTGAVGQPLFARASFGFDLRRWRPTADYRSTYSAVRELGGGILLDAVHELDYLVHLLGPVSEVSAVMAHLSDLETDVEDCVAAWLRFRSGAVGTLDLNSYEAAYRRGCLIVGAEASVTWDWTQGSVVVASSEENKVIDVSCDILETYRAELVDFVGAISERRNPRVTAAESLACLAFADAVRESASAKTAIAVASL